MVYLILYVLHAAYHREEWLSHSPTLLGGGPVRQWENCIQGGALDYDDGILETSFVYAFLCLRLPRSRCHEGLHRGALCRVRHHR